eukprot:scaffold72425_cov32-Tisochrysis_lutea.AAC.3
MIDPRGSSLAGAPSPTCAVMLVLATRSRMSVTLPSPPSSTRCLANKEGGRSFGPLATGRTPKLVNMLMQV